MIMDEHDRFSEADGIKGASLVPIDASDIEKYRPYVDGLDLTEAQATELLMTIYDIMRRFVYLGWEVDLVCEYFFAEGDIETIKERETL